MRRVIALALALGTCGVVASHAQPRRLLTVDDLFSLREVPRPAAVP